MPLTVEPIEPVFAVALKRWFGATVSPDGVKQTSAVPGERTVFPRPQGLNGRCFMIEQNPIILAHSRPQ
jgi:hypothetical protein